MLVTIMGEPKKRKPAKGCFTAYSEGMASREILGRARDECGVELSFEQAQALCDWLTYRIYGVCLTTRETRW